jgi:uncharacterized protein (TIGR00299 family) protein
MSILKIEAFSGMSGDMFLSALAELTESWNEVINLPGRLGLKNVEVKITDVYKTGISCKQIKIIDHNIYSNHDHHHITGAKHFDKNKERDYTISHLQHNHNEHYSKISHHHRHLKDINKIIDDADISNKAKVIAKKIFLFLGEAEAKVHGIDINKIHFHEVGAIDSILDIVGTAFLIDILDIQKVYSTDIRTGKGFVYTEHGELPVPCPATKELLLGYPTYSGDTEGEMTTPTGAAILKYLNPQFDMPTLVEEKTGYGAGEKDFKHPNVLRLSRCALKDENKSYIYIIETNIDDMSSEVIGLDFQQQLFDKGALDFYFTQVIMKKGRPGLTVTVIADKQDIDDIANYILENTTSIGLRFYPVSRKVLPREIKKVHTSLGLIQVKEIVLPSGRKRLSPEYESCLAMAREHGIPVTQIFNKVNSELNN